MKQSIQKLFILFCVGILLLSTVFIGGDTNIVSANPTGNSGVQIIGSNEPVIDEVELTLRFPDTVGKSETDEWGVEPDDPYEILDMVVSGGESVPNRTGWSAYVFECVKDVREVRAGRDENGDVIWEEEEYLYWKELDRYNSDDSHQTYTASNRFIRQAILEQNGEYGQELYDFAVENGAIFEYDPTTPVPDRFLGNDEVGRFNRGQGYTQGRHNVHIDDDWGRKTNNYSNNECRREGQLAYWYGNNEFFVTSTIVTEWYDDGPEGSVQGETYWELERRNENNPSEVAVFSEYEIPYESHVGVRNIQHEVSLANKKERRNTDGTIEFYVNGLQAKDKDLDYYFSYEYTNKEIGWVCVSRDENGCTSWVWDDRPDWRAVKTFSIRGTIPVDHDQFETEKWTKLDDVLKKKWIVGRKDKWNDKSKNSSVYHEEWKRASSNDVPTSHHLNTQTHLPILQGAIEYQVEVPSGKHKESDYKVLRRELSHGYYFPMDVDDSLKVEYENTTDYSGFDYMFPLQQSVMDDKGMTGKKRTYTFDYVTDLFLMSEHTGYMVGVPYADAVKQRVRNKQSLPNVQALINQGKSKLESEFESATGETYRDNALHDDPDDLELLQRYYLPVDATSILHPEEEYKNHIVYENMGLSDAIFEFDQIFEFDHYLFGTAKDNVWIVEQVNSRVPMHSGKTVYISSEQVKQLAQVNNSRTDVRMHSFRHSDRNFVETVKAIVPFSE